MPDNDALIDLIDELEDALRALDAWRHTPPAPEAFESQVPFSADTMAFTEWLQWVFIARFSALIEGGHPLPGQCNVAPMAEEALRGLEGDVAAVLDVLSRIDARFG